MSGLDGAPVPPGGFSIYDGSLYDARYQHYFTISWTVSLALTSLVALPRIYRYSIACGRWKDGWLMRDAWNTEYTPLEKGGKPARSEASKFITARHLLQRITLRTLPGPFPLRIGTLVILLLIPIAILSTVLPDAQLRLNPNRLGYIALAALPPLFFLSAKSSPFAFMTGLAYNRINIFHRWLGRALFVLALSHGSTWIASWQRQGTTASHFSNLKEQYGTLALSFLALLTFSSLRPIRTFSYPLFFVCHVIGFVGFLVAISLHTIYSRSWIGYGVVPIYTLDLIFRAGRLRFTDARAVALPGGATRIHIEDVSGGWRAGQHVQLRALYVAPLPSNAGFKATLFSWLRPFESHPFTISSAPPDVSILPETARGLTIVARTQRGRSWTSDLHDYAATAPTKLGKPMMVLVEGLYGGLGYREPYASESVLLIAGGTGASFIVAVLDEIVGRVVRGHAGAVTRHVDVLWVVRDHDCIEWYGSTLDALVAAAASHLTIRITIHVTSPFITSSSYTSVHCTVNSSATRPSCSLALRKAIRNAINPCQTCLVCNCPPAPHGCADDLEECCDAASRSEAIPLAELGRQSRDSRSTVSAGDTSEKTPLNTPKQQQRGFEGPTEEGKKVEVEQGKGCCAPRTSEKEVPMRQEVRTGGLCVCVCGPSSMVADVSNAVARVPCAAAKRIGGVELISEVYDL